MSVINPFQFDEYVEVGDRVFSTVHGAGEIISTQPVNQNYQILVRHVGREQTYTADGKMNYYDSLPSLFWGEVSLEGPVRPPFQEKEHVSGAMIIRSDNTIDPVFYASEEDAKNAAQEGDIIQTISQKRVKPV